MPIRIEIFADHVRFTATGAMGGDETRSAIDAHFSVHGTRLALWDLRAASFSDVSSSAIKGVNETARRYVEARGPDPRTALLVEDEMDAIFLQAYVARASANNRIATAIFADEAEALAWLRAPGPRPVP